jgi:hypothetical protein
LVYRRRSLSSACAGDEHSSGRGESKVPAEFDDSKAGPLFVYVSGPYSPGSAERDAEERSASIRSNVQKANDAAIAIAKKGHFPFVPHTMFLGWEDLEEVSRSLVMEMCHAWLRRCDALYFMEASPGAQSELELAMERRLPVYQELDAIPSSRDPAPSGISTQAFEGYLKEYEQCMESYRHTYETIWQAGALFGAISAAIVSFAEGDLALLAPIRIIFWYWGVFLPMNGYGEMRNDRLVEIEERLSGAVPGLDMQHYRKFSSSRKGESVLGRLRRLKWKWKPRVKEVVGAFALGLTVVQIYLLWLAVT